MSRNHHVVQEWTKSSDNWFNSRTATSAQISWFLSLTCYQIWNSKFHSESAKVIHPTEEDLHEKYECDKPQITNQSATNNSTATILLQYSSFNEWMAGHQVLYFSLNKSHGVGKSKCCELKKYAPSCVMHIELKVTAAFYRNAII